MRSRAPPGKEKPGALGEAHAGSGRATDSSKSTRARGGRKPFKQLLEKIGEVLIEIRDYRGPLTAAEHHVLLSLATRINAQLECHPSKSQLAQECRLHRGTVAIALAGLVEKRLIWATGKYKGPGRVQVYQLQPLNLYLFSELPGNPSIPPAGNCRVWMGKKSKPRVSRSDVSPLPELETGGGAQLGGHDSASVPEPGQRHPTQAELEAAEEPAPMFES